MSASEQPHTETALCDRVHIRLLDRRQLYTLKPLNRRIFNEERLINTLHHKYLLCIVADLEQQPIGFKIGYSFSNSEFYSAKGAIDPLCRRSGIATLLLHRMELEVVAAGYSEFLYDTFPDKFPGMYNLGLKEGFSVEFTRWNARYQSRHIRLRKTLNGAP